MAEQQTTTPEAKAPESRPAKGEQTKPSAPTDAPLGEGGKKALEAEREARRQAEADLAALRKDFEGFKGTLSEAFGVKPATGDDTGATLQQMQEQLNRMQRDGTVYRLAAEHNITDEEDLDLLRSAKDEAAMTKLASRLAAKAATPGTPKPDATQGGQGTPPALNSDGLEQALKSKLGIA